MVSYKWEMLDSAESATGTEIGTTESVTITEGMVDKFIKVTVTDDAGKTFSAVTTSAVMIDKSGTFDLIDDNGLQTDGTALPEDTLSISYGAALGTPKYITWYRSGAVLKIASLDGGAGITAGAMKWTPAEAGGALKAGEYYVIIENTVGSIWTSNTIVVAESGKAVLSEFSIEDDYDTPTIAYDTTDNEAIINLTMNKQYFGDLYINPSENDNFVAANMVGAAKIDLGSAAAGWATQLTDVKKASNFTNKEAQTKAAGKGIYYIEESGTVHIKLIVPAAGLTRGNAYELIFDQEDIKADNIGASAKEEDLNITSEFVAPYLNAPASIVVSAFRRNTGSMKLTFLDEAGATMEWWTEPNPLGSGTISAYEVADNEVKDSHTAIAPTTPAIEKGVSKLSFTSPAEGAEYAYAKFKTTKGVFAKDSVTLTSAVIESAPLAADKITLEEADTAANAIVKFTNLKSRAVPGTLYVLRNNTGTTVNSTTTMAAVAAEDLKKTSNVMGSVKIEAVTDKVEIEDVFKGSYIDSTAGTTTDEFIALYVPDDEEGYSMIAGADASNDAANWDTKPFELTAKATGFTLATIPTSVTTNTGTIATDNATSDVTDQFGNSFGTTTIAGGWEGKTFEMKALKAEGTDASSAKTASVKFEAAGTAGKAKITLTTYNRTGAAADDTGTTKDETIFYAKVGNTYIVAKKTATAKKWDLSTSATEPTL